MRTRKPALVYILRQQVDELADTMVNFAPDVTWSKVNNHKLDKISDAIAEINAQLKELENS
jgi:hypothetical protein